MLRPPARTKNSSEKMLDLMLPAQAVELFLMSFITLTCCLYYDFNTHYIYIYIIS